VVTAETRADAEADAAESPVRLDGLDDPARRGLRHDRRSAYLLAIVPLVMMVPFVVLSYRSDRLEETGYLTQGTIVATHTGPFPSVELSYLWDGARHVSLVHVDEADKYCAPEVSEFDDSGCISYPTAIVDRDDPGHATLGGELNLSPQALLLYLPSFCFFVSLPVAWCLAVRDARRRRRRRRILENHPWRLNNFQVRGSRERARRRGGLYEVSDEDGVWRSLRFVETRPGRAESLLTDEVVEIAGDAGGGKVVVRAPGSCTLLTAILAPPGLTAVGSVTDAGERCPLSVEGDESADAGPTLLLSGGTGDFDILGPRGESVGEIAQNGTRDYVFDRDGRPTVTVIRRRRRRVATNPQGTEMVTLRGRGRRMTFEFPMGTTGIGRTWATSVAPVGTSKTHWALRDLTGREVAHVTRLKARYVVDIREGDGALGTPLVVQALLVALANPAPR
jgi:hypothetical protein